MSETLEIGLGLAFSLEGSWVAGLHVDADNVPSAAQKEYELLFMSGGLALTGWAAFKFL